MAFQSEIDRNAAPTKQEWLYFFKVKNMAILAAAGVGIYALSKTDWFKDFTSKAKTLKPATEKSTDITKYIVGSSALIAGLVVLAKAYAIPDLQLISMDKETKEVLLSYNGTEITYGFDYFPKRTDSDENGFYLQMDQIEKNSDREGVYVALKKGDEWIKQLEFYF